MNRRSIFSTLLELLGALLIGFALFTFTWQLAAIWIGACLMAAAFAIDRPTPPGGDE